MRSKALNALREKRDEDFAALEAGGMKVVSLEGEAKRQLPAAAREPTWDRMRPDGGTPRWATVSITTADRLFYDPARRPVVHSRACPGKRRAPLFPTGLGSEATWFRHPPYDALLFAMAFIAAPCLSG
jgi:hypothetical protein